MRVPPPPPPRHPRCTVSRHVLLLAVSSVSADSAPQPGVHGQFQRGRPDGVRDELALSGHARGYLPDDRARRVARGPDAQAELKDLKGETVAAAVEVEAVVEAEVKCGVGLCC